LIGLPHHGKREHCHREVRRAAARRGGRVGGGQRTSLRASCKTRSKRKLFGDDEPDITATHTRLARGLQRWRESSRFAGKQQHSRNGNASKALQVDVGQGTLFLQGLQAAAVQQQQPTLLLFSLIDA